MTLVVALALIALRSVPDPDSNAVPYEARIWLTDAKHELRDMAETIMESQTDAACIKEQLIEKLAEESITIEEHGGEFGHLLSLDVVTPPGHDDLLALTFEISIPWGSDSVLYLYRGGRRIFEREVDDYESILDALGSFQWKISPPDDEGAFLVLTAAIAVSPDPAPSMTYTVDRIVPWSDVPQSIIHGEAEDFYGWEDPAPRVTPNGFGLTFRTADLERGARTRVLQYDVDGGRAVRVDPVADPYQPWGFVHEWLSMPDDEAVRWSDVERPPQRKYVDRWWGAIMQCTDGSWQLRVDAEEDWDVEDYYSTYYVVTDLGGTFRMREIREEPLPGCFETGR